MSEYWKSTPKYWCKFCKVFVKDTKLERQQHDATPRHQGNIQRSLRGLHKEKEHEERQKQRAKDEVARLNGVVGGTASPASNSGANTAPRSSANTPVATFSKGAAQKATVEERKRQMQQLADMGVAVPDEFRREMAMAGDWQTVKVTRIAEPAAEQDGDDSKEAVAYGIRKRKFEDQEEEEAIMGTGDAAAPRKNHSWGSRMKGFPGGRKSGGEDLDALLGNVMVKKGVKKEEDDMPDTMRVLTAAKDSPSDLETYAGHEPTDLPELKKSESTEEQEVVAKLEAAAPAPPTAPEDTVPNGTTDAPGAGIVFKKRKKVVK